MRPVRNVFQKLSRTEQRREGVAAYLWCALTSASEAKFEIEAKILFRLEVKKA